MLLSVIIPTYNPRLLSLNKVLAALQNQTLNKTSWELIIIDNNSDNDALQQTDISWHPNSQIINERKQGLTYSRICGFNNARGNIIVMVDDDNVLSADYLATVCSIFSNNPCLGSIGGKITGVFENYEPQGWTTNFWGMLAIRDLGDNETISPKAPLNNYPDYAPVGAGMAIRKELLDDYIKQVINGSATITDRKGNDLSSGGDNELNLIILKQGFAVGYFPTLSLGHIIPAARLTKQYLSRLNYASSRSWVALLLKHNICPWNTIPAWTIPLRKLKAYFTYKPWVSATNYINLHGAFGKFDALGAKK